MCLLTFEWREKRVESETINHCNLTVTEAR